MEKVMGKRYKRSFVQDGLYVNIRKKFFTVRTIIHWNNLKQLLRVPVTEDFQDAVEQGAR